MPAPEPAKNSLMRKKSAVSCLTASTCMLDASQYVQRLVEHYLDHDVWFRQKVKASLDQLDRGEFLSHEEVGERLGKMFQS
jgi:predicted transcriptional regulator